MSTETARDLTVENDCREWPMGGGGVVRRSWRGTNNEYRMRQKDRDTPFGIEDQ